MGLAPRALHRHQQAGPGLGADPVDLALADGLGGVGDDLLDQLGRGGALAARGGGVDREQADVAIGIEARIDGVGEAAILAQLLEQARRHAAADRVREQPRGVIIRMELGRAGEAEREMGLVAGGAADPVAAGKAGGLGRRRWCRRKLAEQAVGELDEPGMIRPCRRRPDERLPARYWLCAPVVEIVDR